MNLNIISVPVGPIYKDAAAKMIGLHVYDVALPQQWLDKAVKKLCPEVDVEEMSTAYALILSNVVWCYDNATIFGQATPLTVRGAAVLNKVDELSPDQIYTVISN